MNGVSAIFDAPGPRGRRWITMITAISLIAIAFALFMAGRQFQISGQLDPAKWSLFLVPANQRFFLTAMRNTALAAAGGAAIALPLGLVLALGRLSRFRIVRAPATGVIEFFRAVPLLLIILVFMFALPKYGMNPNLYWKLVIPIGLCDGATIAEVFRAGILSLPRGQKEAGLANGLTDNQTFWNVVFPQAVRIVVPSLVAQVVILLKDTTLGYIVSYTEMQYQAQVFYSFHSDLSIIVSTLLVVSLLYVILNVSISAVARWLERRLGTPRAVRQAAANDLAQ